MEPIEIPVDVNQQQNLSRPMTESKEQDGRIIQERISKLQIPKRFRCKSFANLSGREKEIELGLSAITEGKSIFITGSNGSGKTHLAVSFLRTWAKRVAEGIEQWETPKINGFFLPCIEFFFQLKGTFGTENQEYSIIEKYSDFKMLCIDDLGVEKISDWSRQCLFALIDRRYRDCKQTIITSNLSLSELSEQLDNRIASRIVEMGIILDMGDKDFRMSG